MSLHPGDRLALLVEKPAAGGRMIARADGQVVLVTGAIPGERVDALVERVAKGVVFAATTGVLEASPDRRPTAANPLCGGCLLAHVNYSRQLALKSEIITDAFRRVGRMELPSAPTVAASPEEGYRMRAGLHARGGSLGFFLEGTHAVCAAAGTRQLLPATIDVLDRLNALLRSLGIAQAEIELAENADASSRVLHVEAGVPIDRRVAEQVASIDGVTGASVPGGSHGAVHVTDTVRVGGQGIALRRHVLAFFQGNRYLLDAFASHVIDRIDPGSRVIDLYAGVGLFAIGAAVCRGADVTAVEGDRVGAADLAGNAETAGRGAVRPVHESVEAFAAAAGAQPSATIVVDPPRTGMSREALQGVIALAARRIVYVSCDVATLARDARRLVDAGYRLIQLDAFDLFPNTPHVESVGVFEK